MSAQEAQTAALKTLTKVMEDTSVKVEVRIEAAKIVLNRPRFFVGPETTEA